MVEENRKENLTNFN